MCDCDDVRYCKCDKVAIDYIYEGMTESELENFLSSNGITFDDFCEYCGVCIECVEDSESGTCYCNQEELDCNCNANHIECTCNTVACSSNHKYTCSCENQSCSTNHSYSCPCESVVTNPPCQCNTVSDCSRVCTADCTCD